MEQLGFATHVVKLNTCKRLITMAVPPSCVCAMSSRDMEPGATNLLPGFGCGKVTKYTIRFEPAASLPASNSPTTAYCDAAMRSGPFARMRHRTRDSIAKAIPMGRRDNH